MEAHIASVSIASRDGGQYMEISFAGCNFRCPWCYVPEMLDTKEEFITDLRDIKSQIKENASSLDAVIFTGGEPCLQRQALLNIAGYCKDLQLRTVLHTNGSKPGCVHSLLQAELLDAVILDIKSSFSENLFERATRSKTFFITTGQIIEDIRLVIRTLMRYNGSIDIEIRTTIIPGLVFRKEDLLFIAEEIERLDCRWRLQRFEPGNTVSKNYFDLKPPSHGFLEDLKESVQKKYYSIRIVKD